MEENCNNRNLIDMWCRIVSEITDAPLVAIKLASYFVASAVLGGSVAKIRGLPTKIKPNIYAVIAGPPGISKKDTTLYYVRETLQKIWGVEEYMNRVISTGVGTVEGIADEIIANNLRYPIIISSEFGCAIRSLTKKDWQSDVPGLLNNLYDGVEWKQSLSKRRKNAPERRIPPGTYAVLLGAMQDPRLYLTPELVQQGFVRRLLLLALQAKDMDRHLPLVDEMRERADGELERLAQIFRQREQEIANVELMFATEEDKNYINEIDTKMWRVALSKFKENPLDGVTYIGTDAIKLVKLAAINALADLDNPVATLPDGSKILHIRRQHIDNAYSLFSIIECRFIEMLNDVMTGTGVGKVDREEAVMMKILRIINAKGKNDTITVSDLMKFSNLTKDSLRRYLVTLMERRDVYVIGVKYRRWYFYVTTNRATAEYTVERYKNAGYEAELFTDYNTNEFIDLWYGKKTRIKPIKLAEELLKP